MKAKKSFGQHFLTNEHIAERIANALPLIEAYPRVLEVGPGRGMLTKHLIEKPIDLKVVEADRMLIPILEQVFPSLNGSIIEGDFLKYPLDRAFEKQPFLLIGNYPYNISSQIVFRMIKYRDLIPQMAGMFQKEMADRIVAPPGNKTYGVISVLTQAYYEGKMLFKVEKGNFNPPPKVQSAVILLTRKEDQELGVPYGWFRRVVKQAFNQRRKMLRNTMKALLPEKSELLTNEFLTQRPEQLSVEAFVQLTKWVMEENGENPQEEK